MNKAGIYEQLLRILEDFYKAKNGYVIQRKENQGMFSNLRFPDENVALTNSISAAIEEISILRELSLLSTMPIGMILDFKNVLKFVSLLELIPDQTNNAILEFSIERKMVLQYTVGCIVKYTKEGSNIYKMYIPIELDSDVEIYKETLNNPVCEDMVETLKPYKSFKLDIESGYGSKSYTLDINNYENDFKALLENDIVFKHAIVEILDRFFNILDYCINLHYNEADSDILS